LPRENYINGFKLSQRVLQSTIYIIVSVVIVSLVSLVGVFSLLLNKKFTSHLLLLVSLSAGTLFGGAFLHLLPEAVELAGFGIKISVLVLLGVLAFFVLEKFIHWKHCHGHNAGKVHGHNPSYLAPLNIFGDAIHNLLDGLVIAGSYLVSIPAGIATTVTVVLHEVPQEIADFGVLIYSGLSNKKALFYNFLSASISIVGAIGGIYLGSKSTQFVSFILPFAAGGFVYIAGSNLIPELHKDCGLKDSFQHFFFFLLGLVLMYLLTFIG
jgi:zinc and cadmium transporter